MHVITETATHAGHLDTARELIDGGQQQRSRALTNIMIQPIILVMKTMSLAAAKTQFSALVDEAVSTHEQVTVTRNGVPAVVVLSVEDFESLLETLAILQDPEDRAVFEQARREADEGDVIEEDEMGALMRERLARRADQ